MTNRANGTSVHSKSTLPLIITGIICLAITFSLNHFAHNWQNERLSSELDRRALTYRTLFQQKIDSYFGQVNALQRFFDGSDEVTRSDFAAFVRPVLKNDAAIKSFIWLPRISKIQKTAFEKAPWETGLGGRLIHNLQSGQKQTEQSLSPAYFPMAYIEPMPSAQQGIGFDLSSDPACGEIFSAIVRSAKPAINTNINDFHGLANLYKNSNNLSLIIEPVFDQKVIHSSVKQKDREANLKGYLILVFDLGQSFENSILGTSIGGIHIDLFDTQDDKHKGLLFSHASRAKAVPPSFLSSYIQNEPVQAEHAITLPSSQWVMTFSPNHQFYAQNYEWRSEFVLLLGLLITGGVLFFIYSNRRRYQHIESIVEARTRSLKASQQEQLSTLESISNIFFTVNSNWAFIYVNPRAEDLFGASNEALRGKNIWDEFPEFSSFFYRPLHQVLKTQAPQKEDLLHYSPKNLWLSLRANPFPDGVSVYLMDVTERVKEQTQRQHAEQRTKTILETAVDGIITINERGIVQSLNPAAEHIFGYDEVKVLGQNIKMLMPEPDRSQHDGYLRNHLRTGKEKIIGVGREVVGLRANGETFPMDLAVSEMQLGDQRQFVGIVRDISTRIHSEEQIRQSQKMDALGKLAGGVAHEFNNLLVGIMGFASMAQEDIDDRDLVEMSLREVSLASSRASALTQELLTFSRKKQAKAEVASIGTLIKDVTNFLRTLMNTSVQLNVEIENENTKIEVDAGQFSQAIINLVINARDAMPSKGKISVTSKLLDEGSLLPSCLSDSEQKSFICVRVSDTGSGMDAETKAQLFEPFFSTKPLGEGTGLGLSMVYGFVEQSRGTIEVESEIDLGTVFNLYFPVSQKDLSTPEDNTKVLDKDWGKGLTALVVDDENLVCKFASVVLREAGLHVITANDGQEALDLWRESDQDFDIILSDIMMPELNGPQMIECIQKDDPDIKVVFMSGFPGQLEALPEDLYSSTNFIEKPFTKRTLLHAMADIASKK